MQAADILVANGKTPKRRTKKEAKGMRRRILAALCLCAAAETETDGLYSRVEPIFADAFFEEVGNVLFSQSSAVAGNRVASLKMKAMFMCTMPQQRNIACCAAFPLCPKGPMRHMSNWTR